MLRPMRLLLCASAAALIAGAAPGVNFAFVAPAHAQADIVVTASIAPPELPVYSQPPIPGPGYVWIPGYWAWDGSEYYWVPGYWELPPAVGLLWTPGYWAWNDTDDDYVFNAGYWGPTVGFYGGIDYGFGYPGVGYFGGYWQNNVFVYNTTVNNLGNVVRIAKVFTKPVAETHSTVAFNGGPGGTTAKPTAAELAAAHQRHGMAAAQIQHQQMASRDPALRFAANHVAPPIAATQRANEFRGAHIAAATAAGATAAAAAHAAHAAAALPRPTGTPHAAPGIPHAAPGIAHAAPGIAPRAAPRIAHAAPAMRGPAFHPHFAARAPAMHFGGAPAFAGGAPHFAGGGPHFGGAPAFGGGAPHFAGGARTSPAADRISAAEVSAACGLAARRTWAAEAADRDGRSRTNAGGSLGPPAQFYRGTSGGYWRRLGRRMSEGKVSSPSAPS